MRYKMQIAYDGSAFSGWQLQPNAVSIQGEIEKALFTLLKKPVRVIGSGRTDAGTHAMGQVAHFDAEKMPSLLALNGILPKEIRILSLEETDDSFHAQYSAKGKTYHYHLWLEKVSDPFLYKYRYRVPFPISLDLLHEAAQAFVGTHDFTTFSNVGSSVKSSIRTIKRIDIVKQKGGVRLEFEGDGFLYKMVRNIVGTLLEVASHQNICIEELLASRDRRAAGVCAPAHALFLMEVDYGMSQCDETCHLASQSPLETKQRSPKSPQLQTQVEH